MIEIYSREGCKGCEQVKAIMNYYGLTYAEHKLDVDVTSEWVRDNFPGRNNLPILVIDGEVFAGPQEASKMLNEYRRDAGKQLLNEGTQDDFDGRQ